MPISDQRHQGITNFKWKVATFTFTLNSELTIFEGKFVGHVSRGKFALYAIADGAIIYYSDYCPMENFILGRSFVAFQKAGYLHTFNLRDMKSHKFDVDLRNVEMRNMIVINDRLILAQTLPLLNNPNDLDRSDDSDEVKLLVIDLRESFEKPARIITVPNGEIIKRRAWDDTEHYKLSSSTSCLPITCDNSEVAILSVNQ